MIARDQVVDKPLMIALQDLEYNILKNLNLHVRSGEIYSIIGKPDSGKNELLRCINRINEPKYGKITIDNQNLKIITIFSNPVHSDRLTIKKNKTYDLIVILLSSSMSSDVSPP